MKAIVCEMCGGQELLKKDGVFVCQHCGTQYTAEEAKKLIVEAKVDISGSAVTVDNLPQVKAILTRAREFEDKKDSIKAREYYNKVLDIDPHNTEALEGIRRIDDKSASENAGCILWFFGILFFVLIVLPSWFN